MESSPGREISRRLRHSSTRHSGGSGKCPRLPIDSPPLRSVQDDRRPLCARAFRLPETDVRQGPSLEVTLSPCLSRAPCRSCRLCCPPRPTCRPLAHCSRLGVVLPWPGPLGRSPRSGPCRIWLARLNARACPLPLAEPAAGRRPPLHVPPAVCLGSPPVCERATFTLTQEVSPWPLTYHAPSNRFIAPPSVRRSGGTRARAARFTPSRCPAPSWMPRGIRRAQARSAGTTSRPWRPSSRKPSNGSVSTGSNPAHCCLWSSGQRQSRLPLFVSPTRILPSFAVQANTCQTGKQ